MAVLPKYDFFRLMAVKIRLLELPKNNDRQDAFKAHFTPEAAYIIQKFLEYHVAAYNWLHETDITTDEVMKAVEGMWVEDIEGYKAEAKIER